ncbi:MAG: hypothetical protein ABJN11_14065 [Lentilitoribacter sp.]
MNELHESTKPHEEIALKFAEVSLKQGEIYLGHQWQSGIASDARATTVATVFAAFSALIAAAVISYWETTSDFRILFSGVLCAFQMGLGAVVCMHAARPVEFNCPGNNPDNWLENYREPLNSMIFWEAKNYGIKIKENDNVLRRNAKTLVFGLNLGILSPIVSFASWLVLIIFS